MKRNIDLAENVPPGCTIARWDTSACLWNQLIFISSVYYHISLHRCQLVNVVVAICHCSLLHKSFSPKTSYLFHRT